MKFTLLIHYDMTLFLIYVGSSTHTPKPRSKHLECGTRRKPNSGWHDVQHLARIYSKWFWYYLKK